MNSVEQTPQMAVVAASVPTPTELTTPAETGQSDVTTLPWQTPTAAESGCGMRRAIPRSTAQPIVPREEACWPVTTLLGRYPELRFERWLPGVLRSIKKTNGTVFDERVLRGPRGHVLCLWCGKETPTPQTLFCATPSGRSHLETEFGEGCAHEHRMRRDNQYVRRQLLLRDGGICYDCGVDTHALFVQAVACTTLKQRVDMFKTLAKQACEWKKKVKYPLSSMECEFNAGMFWEAAHKVDVKHGGGLCGLDGFQTICVPCHSSVYSRNYSAEVASLSFLRSPSEAPSHASTSLLQSADWASPALLSAQCRAPPGFVYSPTQSLCSAYSTTESQLAATPARTSLGRQHADTSPVSLSSASPSSLPSPTSNYVLCAPSHSRLPETPTKSPPTNMSSKLGGIRCQLAQHEANPSNQLPLVQLSATIDLTTSTREVASHACDRPELDSLADMLTTINISSSGEESSSEVEIVPVVTQRMPLSTRKIDANSHKQGDTQQQQRPVAKAKDASANEGRARPGLAQRPLSDNPSALRRPSLTRMSSRSESASQENSPAARGVAPLTSDSSTKESTVSTTRRGQLPDRHILLL